jgi:hypothetical protein
MLYHSDFFESTRVAVQRVRAPRWTRRRTILFSVFSGLALWAALGMSVRFLIG